MKQSPQQSPRSDEFRRRRKQQSFESIDSNHIIIVGDLPEEPWRKRATWLSLIAVSGVIQFAVLYLTGVMWPSLIDHIGLIFATSIPAAPSPSPPKLHNNGFCRDDEEHFAGLCYKKCNINSHTLRTSPWTCCERQPCFVNQQLRMAARIACAGYAVNGEGKCPRVGTSCPDDEETLSGVCYKKCSLLTNHTYPHRFGPAMCCKTGGVSCLYLWKTHLDPERKKEARECFEDEEMMLGACSKKCSLLTDNRHNRRLGPFSCCGVRQEFQMDTSYIERGVWHIGCFDLQNMTSITSDHLPSKKSSERAS